MAHKRTGLGSNGEWSAFIRANGGTYGPYKTRQSAQRGMEQIRRAARRGDDLALPRTASIMVGKYTGPWNKLTLKAHPACKRTRKGSWTCKWSKVPDYLVED